MIHSDQLNKYIDFPFRLQINQSTMEALGMLRACPMNRSPRPGSITMIKSKLCKLYAVYIGLIGFRNISTSELAFRIAVDNPERAKQDQADSDYDHHAHLKTWGMVMDYGK